MTFSQPLELLSHCIYLLNLLLVTICSWPNRSDEQLDNVADQLGTETLGKEMLQEEMSNSSL